MSDAPACGATSRRERDAAHVGVPDIPPGGFCHLARKSAPRKDAIPLASLLLALLGNSTLKPGN
jgi:hypothetical protein